MPKERHALIPTAEAARRLGCHVRTVHRLVAAGTLIPAAKIPGRTGAMMFHAADVDRVVADRADEAAS